MLFQCRKERVHNFRYSPVYFWLPAGGDYGLWTYLYFLGIRTRPPLPEEEAILNA